MMDGWMDGWMGIQIYIEDNRTDAIVIYSLFAKRKVLLIHSVNIYNGGRS
jgi:hypothetical protein